MAARIDLLQFPDTPLDLELAACNIGRSLAQRALQVVNLDEGLDILAFPSLGEMPRQAQDLLAVGVLLRLLPASRFP